MKRATNPEGPYILIRSQKTIPLWFLGLNSIIVVYMDPLGNISGAWLGFRAQGVRRVRLLDFGLEVGA